MPYVSDERPAETSTLYSPIYINGALTSSINPLLWHAKSVLAFAFISKAWHFIGVAGHDNSTSVHNTALPIFTYSTAPSEADLPMRPCYYYVTSTGAFNYCDGLA